MTPQERLPGHEAILGRRDLGSSSHGGYHCYATTVACSCGRWSTESSNAPSRGGRSLALAAYRYHLESVISRDPLQTAMRAHKEWRAWQPGDGSCYWVRIHVINDGPDHRDRVLLVNINRRTWSFQYPVAAYRQREMGTPAQRRRALADQATGDWFGRVVAPLLVAEGVIDPYGVET